MNIKILNYKIHIDFSFIFIITLLFFLNKSFYIISALLASSIHEFGHLIVLKKIRTKSEQLDVDFRLFKLNIVDQNRLYTSFLEDLKVLISGPFFNFITFLLFFVVSKLSKNYKLYFFALENLFLFIFNLLPIAPLDGGQILFIILLSNLDFVSAQKIISIISLILIYILSFIGFFIFLYSKYNISVLLLSMYMIYFLYKKIYFYF